MFAPMKQRCGANSSGPLDFQMLFPQHPSCGSEVEEAEGEFFVPVTKSPSGFALVTVNKGVVTPTPTPTVTPTEEPTVTPTVTPTIIPTISPTVTPTEEPTVTHKEATIPSIAAGKSAKVQLSYKVPDNIYLGAYTIRGLVNPYGTIPETNEGDNAFISPGIYFISDNWIEERVTAGTCGRCGS